MGIATHLQGTIDNLKGVLHIDYGNNDIVLSAEASARHLSDPGKTTFSGKVERLNATSTALPQLLQEILPERPGLAKRFSPIGEWQFFGEIDKNHDGLNANGTLACYLGEIQGNVSMNISDDDHIDVFSLNGELKLSLIHI